MDLHQAIRSGLRRWKRGADDGDDKLTHQHTDCSGGQTCLLVKVLSSLTSTPDQKLPTPKPIDRPDRDGGRNDVDDGSDDVDRERLLDASLLEEGGSVVD